MEKLNMKEKKNYEVIKKWDPSLTLVRENNELDIEISSFFIIIYCVLLTYYDIM